MSILLEHHNPANQMMGEILISQQWITPSQLASAIAEQKKTNQRLGEILVRLGFLSDMELNFILSQQKGNTLTGETDNVKVRLGDILRKSKRLSQRELSFAVEEQKSTNEKLGETLLRLGLLQPEELDAVLAWQDDFNQADPMAVRLLLGEILIASKRIGRKELEAALTQQRLTKKQIGQILLESGHVTKFDLRNALKIQSKMVAAGLLAMMSAMALTGCGAPTVGSELQHVSYNKGKLTRQVGVGSYQMGTNFKVASLPGGRQLQVFADGSKLVKDVPFFKQGADNTCAQASTAVVVNFWDVKQSYQDLVDQQNRFNTPTHYDNIVKFIQSKGLKAKAMRSGSIGYLKSLIDQGKPPIVLLEFNEDLFQQHYISVVGYNAQKGTIIFHDSIDGPYRQLDEEEFQKMWNSEHLSSLPLFGGANYKGLIIEVSK